MSLPEYRQSELEQLRSIYPSANIFKLLDEAGRVSPEAWAKQLHLLSTNTNGFEYLATLLDDNSSQRQHAYLIRLCQYLMEEYSNLVLWYRKNQKGDKRLLR